MNIDIKKQNDVGIPSTVIETLYVNNRAHAAYLLTDAGGKKVAQTEAHGIINWLREYQVK